MECEECDENETHPRYGVVNITINKSALTSWLFNNPDIAHIVNVIFPDSINYFLAHRYEALAMKHLDLYEKGVNRKIKESRKPSRFGYIKNR